MSDSPLYAIATNLLASALWELLLHPAYRGAVGFISPDDDAQVSAIEDAVASAATVLTQSGDHVGVPFDVWEAFLSSPEAQELVTDLFAYQLSHHATTDEITVAFGGLWREFTESQPRARAIDPADIMDRLSRITTSVLDAAVRRGVLEAHEAKSAARHRILGDRLAQMERRLARDSHITTEEAAIFSSQLRAEMRQRYSTIEPPSLQARERVPIDDLYVEPDLELEHRPGNVPLSLAMLASSTYRRVILGHPGAGKSTLTVKLCHLLGDLDHTPPAGLRSLTPWRIELRKYAATPAPQRASFVEYFAAYATGSHALPASVDVFEHLLERGHLFVILDGLDELLEVSEREYMRNAIESFCRRYPRTPVLVTSRVIGYDHTPLDPSAFDIVRIAEFSPTQVETYTRKWFRRELSLSPEERDEKVAGFLTQSQVAADLRRSPLLLALMCAYYMRRGAMPNNLPDIYGGCAELLFENWDKTRGIVSVLPFAEHVRPALNDLAHWIFTTQRLSDGVTFSETVERTTQFLAEFRFARDTEARAAAHAFVKFCRGRAWVFTDTGEVRNGEELFAFTHRTFLEFFCAEYMQLVQPTPRALVDELIDRIGMGGWEIVTRLALQMKARSLLDGADSIVGRLAYHAERAPLQRRTEIQTFILEALGALVPSPRTVSGLANSILSTVGLGMKERMADEGVGDASRPERAKRPPEAFELLRTLTNVEREFNDQLERAICDGLGRALEGRTTRFASEIGFWTADMFSVLEEDVRAFEFWERVRRRLQRDYSTLLDGVCRVHRDVALDAHARGGRPLARLIEDHGWAVVLGRRRREIMGEAMPAPGPDAIVRLFQGAHSNQLRARSSVMALEPLALATGAPWIPGLKEIDRADAPDVFTRLLRLSLEDQRGVNWLGAWSVAALCFEVKERTERQGNWRAPIQGLQARDGPIGAFACLMLARVDGHAAEAARQAEVLAISPSGRELVSAWVSRDLSLIG